MVISSNASVGRFSLVDSLFSSKEKVTDLPDLILESDRLRFDERFCKEEFGRGSVVTTDIVDDEQSDAGSGVDVVLKFVNDFDSNDLIDGGDCSSTRTSSSSTSSSSSLLLNSSGTILYDKNEQKIDCFESIY